jgi:hypothetical protein
VPSDEQDPGPQQSNVEPRQIHLVLDPLDLFVIIDALRSVGNVDFADRLDEILRQFAR